MTLFSIINRKDCTLKSKKKFENIFNSFFKHFPKKGFWRTLYIFKTHTGQKQLIYLNTIYTTDIPLLDNITDDTAIIAVNENHIE